MFVDINTVSYCSQTLDVPSDRLSTVSRISVSGLSENTRVRVHRNDTWPRGLLDTGVGPSQGEVHSLKLEVTGERRGVIETDVLFPHPTHQRSEGGRRMTNGTSYRVLDSAPRSCLYRIHWGSYGLPLKFGVEDPGMVLQIIVLSSSLCPSYSC